MAVSVCAFNLYDTDTPAAMKRFARLETQVRGLDADVLAVREVVAREPSPGNEPGKRELATAGVRWAAKL
ncbi:MULTISPECIES: hypothetical protein [unclassified Amycolatopsis]|uniref:hypothetical protein n=1 Tax=unclassified Amycolatopsis TaxID=2618356 RepID=UPI001C6A825F|nr:hypothetical protein [Amycolatopsis sp. DSM 110486]QYN19145.1 hypothetical protein K1T34_41875 [Amycolatopsis sp. DSM 110486]